MFFKALTPRVLSWMQGIGAVSSVGLALYMTLAHGFSFFLGWEFWFLVLFSWGILVKLSRGRLIVMGAYPVVLGLHSLILLLMFWGFDLLVLPFLAGFGLANFSLIFFLIVVHLLGTE